MIDREAFYDDEVAPLMSEIIRICQSRDIPFMASFQLSDGNRDQDDGTPLMCTTAVCPQEWATDSLGKAVRAVMGQPSAAFAIITTSRDGAVSVEHTLASKPGTNE